VIGESVSALLAPTRAPEAHGEPLRIWGGVPLRNPTFTGRDTLLLTLQRALERRSKASVLPHALHGMGGVGKTQLAVEFAYRYADRYDIVWWIPAEHQSLVLQSLRQLGRHLRTPDTANLQQAASLVLDQLAATPLRWLLVYDNANDPDDIASLIPSAGGHVILTSRNQTWSDVWDPIQVDVFDRRESVELVRKRSGGVSAEEADRLADRLGDLPLALDQAASLQAATGMPVAEYLALLDQLVREQSGDEPASYRTTIAALVSLALQRLRVDAPAVAELLEMFAYLGAEPISGGLLRRGRDARVSAALGRALRDQISLDRVIRDLRRYGLAKVDPDLRIQVHRLFQLVLRDELDEDAARRSRTNVHQVLASANPAYPDDEETWPVHAELGPHIVPAELIDADLLDARRVVLDQIRYLLVIGDQEGSQRLGQAAVDAWSKVEGMPGLGPNGELTLIATRELAYALRRLGFNERSRSLIEDTLERLRDSPEFGPDHEHTLNTAGEAAASLRVAGLFGQALALDHDTVARYRRVVGDEDPLTLRAHSNLAVNLRMLSDFAGAYEIDADVVRTWQQTVSENDNRLLFAQANLARDLYGLGRYADALDLQRQILPPYRQQLGQQHPYVLLAGRTLAITLRKVGRYADGRVAAAEHHRDTLSRYGPEHEHSLAAAMSHANSLRLTGDVAEADRLATEAMDRYLRVFGEDHPLSLAAAVNYGIVLRGRGEPERARELDERTHARMTDVLGAAHGYTLCAANNLTNGLVPMGDLAAARRLSGEALAASRQTRGEQHPYTLACAVNAALDLIAVGESEKGSALLDQTVTAFGEVLGPGHPETVAARERRRAECDIEPPPT
jgi:tetratricopeptide (TPR) repeat protein